MRNERLFSSRTLGAYAVFTVIFLLGGLVRAGAQQAGAITGRVIDEDGRGMPHLGVWISQAGSGARENVPRQVPRVTTDEEGNFRFTDLPPGPYTIDVPQAKEYAMPFPPGTERASPRYFYLGDNVTIKLVKGGAITGSVTTPEGEPMVRAQVMPIMVRDAEGNPIHQSVPTRWKLADDRGVYRLFGLTPGSYIVFTNGSSFFSRTPYTQQTQAYHPSSTRDTAAEVTVASGGEVTGVDIRFREDRGRVVSGTVAGSGEQPSPPQSSLPAIVRTRRMVSLVNVATGAALSGSLYPARKGGDGFAIYGVTDGQYEIIARDGGSGDKDGFVSLPRRVTVKGANVTGINLKLLPAASISGKIVIEPSTDACETNTRGAGRQEVMVSMRVGGKSSISSQSTTHNFRVDDRGEFTIRTLRPGRYHLGSILPDENWYLRSITAPSARRGRRRAVIARLTEISVAGGVRLNSGGNLTGVTMTVADGAALLRGKIVAKDEGYPPPSRFRVHLIPREKAAANDALRYAETLSRGDHTFEFKNLAPGKYWLVVRVIPDWRLDGRRRGLPLAWDRAKRVKLRRNARAGGIKVELKPCQRSVDQVLKY